MTDDLDPTGPPVPDLAAMFEPLSIRGMTLRNRFVMPAMQRRWCIEGRPMPELVDYYRRRAVGGTSLIITESCAIDHPTATQDPQFAWMTDDTKEAWRECADVVRAQGSHFFVQLWHEGAIRPEGGDGPLSMHPTLSPSGLMALGKPNGRAATLDELMQIKTAYVHAALNAQEIGASGIEIHACHGYLLDEFLWRDTNQRTDGYGGDDIHDRVRFPAEVVAAIRGAVDDDFVISFRFSQWKEIDYHARIADSPEELRAMLTVLRAAGVDLFHVSARRFWEAEWPELDPDLGIAAWTKSMTDAPVAAVGSVGLDIDIMDNLLGEEATPTGVPSFVEMLRRFDRGDFDLMSIGRGQIGDPNWVSKVRDGAISDIRSFTRADMLRDMQIPTL